jgi:hypothetical protein
VVVATRLLPSDLEADVVHCGLPDAAPVPGLAQVDVVGEKSSLQSTQSGNPQAVDPTANGDDKTQDCQGDEPNQ